LVGSSPLNTPASIVIGPMRAAPTTTTRSSTWARWWLTGYFTNGRTIGSSLPNGTKPRPAVSDTPAPRPPTSKSARAETKSSWT
jgi:hypothetical protein